MSRSIEGVEEEIVQCPGLTLCLFPTSVIIKIQGVKGTGGMSDIR
jgi:hypothetical protein